MKRYATLLLCVTMSACSPADQTIIVNGVTYGPPTTIKGAVASNWEDRFFALCGDDPARCGKTFYTKSCDLVLGRKALETYQKLPAIQNTGNELWIEGRGRVSVRNGTYGHLGGHPCSVLIERIDKADPNDKHPLLEWEQVP